MTEEMFRALPSERPLARMLPSGVARMLAAAAMTEPRIPIGESRARTHALDAAISYVRKNHPNYFKD